MQGFNRGKLEGREQGRLSEHLQLSHDMGDVMKMITKWPNSSLNIQAMFTFLNTKGSSS